MAFSINEFKSQFDSRGGPAKTSLFTVSFSSTPTNDFISGQDLLFFCKTAEVPGINLNVIEHKYNALDSNVSIPTGMTNEPINCIFMCDSQHRILSFFHHWMQKIYNYSTSGGQFSSINDQLPYELGYVDEYKARMTIRYYGVETSENTNYYEVILDDLYPIKVESITLSWEDNNQVANLPVSFAYRKKYFSAETSGIPTDRFSRGNGLLDLIVSVGYPSQLIVQTDLPTSIQDAINNFTRVGNIISSSSAMY